jgi:hypothetical protein
MSPVFVVTPAEKSAPWRSSFAFSASIRLPLLIADIGHPGQFLLRLRVFSNQI